MAGLGETRTEHDLIGVLEVPTEAYYGIHTVRALENFPVTGRPIGLYPDLVRGDRATVAAAEALALETSVLGLLKEHGLVPEGWGA